LWQLFVYQGDVLILQTPVARLIREAHEAIWLAHLSGAPSAGDEVSWRTIDFPPMEMYIRIEEGLDAQSAAKRAG
jgi:hypothetical protein